MMEQIQKIQHNCRANLEERSVVVDGSPCS